MLPKGLMKEHSKMLAMSVRTMDMLIVLCAACFAYYLKFHTLFPRTPYWQAMGIGMLLVPFVFPFFSIYASVRGEGFFKHILNLTQAVATWSILLAGLAFFTKTGETFSRLWFIFWIGNAWLFLILLRCALITLLRLMRAHGMNEKRVVIMGAGALGSKLAENMQQAMWTGFHIVTFFDDVPSVTTVQNISVLQTPENLSDYLTAHDIDELWLALPLHAQTRVKEILHELRHHTITTRFILDIFSLDLLNHSITDLAGFPVLNIRSTPMRGFNRIIKAVEDRVLAILILLAISPLLIILALAIKCSSKGPVFYRQKRVGWNGKEFEMLKFRTMPVNAEEKTGPVWAKPQDSRPTPLGKFLRQTSLDELPQFINVLKGDMSIVGPRPERKVFVEEFKDQIPRYMQKHLVKAGITGWAQINGWRGNTSLEKRIEYDLYYIENWSLAFDLKIIFLTFFHGFIHRNAY